MLVALVCCLAVIAAATAAPATYDQRQDGELNYDVDVRNIVVLGIYPSNFPTNLFTKNAKHNRESEAQERADVHGVLEAFVEPSEPYHVEIGDGRQADGGDGRAVEVVIAARRRPDVVLQTVDDTPPDHQRNTADVDEDEYKLIGATEQCGPDRERDPVTLICRARSVPPVAAAPDASAIAATAEPAAASMQQQITIQHVTPEVVPASS